MYKKVSKTVTRILAGALCVTTVCGNSASAFAANDMFQVATAGSGYAITGIHKNAVVGGAVTIPDTIDGIDVIQLGSSGQSYTFLGRNEVEKLTIGKNVKGATTYAFYGAKDLAEIEISSDNHALQFNDNILRGKSGGKGILIKYISPAPKTDYTVPDDIARIFNMDYAQFQSLDLNAVTRIEKFTFAGSEIDNLKIKDAALNSSYDVLYGATVNSFDATGSTLYESDGKALWKDGRLIKLAYGADFEDGYFDQFSSISPYAFNSIAEYQNLQNMLPESLTKNVVFSFFTQDEGVFIVNNEVSFCYNYDKKVPTNVGDSTEYSPDIDSEKYEKIKALMYVGVPFNGTGLFEEVFGEDYENVAADPETTRYGNAALNVVSAIIYNTVDKANPAEIKGIGHGPFTQESVTEYKQRLIEAIEQYEKYNFKPSFSLENNTVRFHRENGKYVSDPIQIDTVDGTGVINNSYIYTIYLQNEGITVRGGQDNFKTGTPVILESTEKPTEFTVAYNEPSLKYYKRTSNDVQNVLASASRKAAMDLNVSISVDSIVISKQDIVTGKELPGAKLELEYNGQVIDTWISTEKPHAIENLEDGEYILRETTAPEGYEIAEEINFTVKDGAVEGGMIIMYDKPIPKTITISKVDAATGEELPGARLILTKLGADNTVIDDWISGQVPHIITGIADGEYMLSERTAPDGYEVAENIIFTVKDGAVIGGPVIMKDKLKKATPSDATPSEATPSEPDEPDEPDVPDTPIVPDKPSAPDEPSVPDKPITPDKPSNPGGSSGSGNSGGGGHSSGGHSNGGSSNGGPGYQKVEEKPAVVPIPAPVMNPEQPVTLPKTSDTTSAALVLCTSILTLLYFTKKKYRYILPKK